MRVIGARAAIALFTFAWTIVPQTAHAGSHQQADALLMQCSADTHDPAYRVKRAQCDGYLAGVYDLLFARKSVTDEACVPRRVTPDRLRGIVVDYLKHNPADLGSTAATAVRAAAARAWPACGLT